MDTDVDIGCRYPHMINAKISTNNCDVMVLCIYIYLHHVLG